MLRSLLAPALASMMLVAACGSAPESTRQPVVTPSSASEANPTASATGGQSSETTKPADAPAACSEFGQFLLLKIVEIGPLMTETAEALEAHMAGVESGDAAVDRLLVIANDLSRIIDEIQSRAAPTLLADSASLLVAGLQRIEDANIVGARGLQERDVDLTSEARDLTHDGIEVLRNFGTEMDTVSRNPNCEFEPPS